MITSESERLSVADLGSGVLHLEMRGPRGNPMDLVLVRELADTLDALTSEQGCRVVVLSSADRHFCVGATGKLSGADGWSTPDLYAELPRLFRFPKPIVAVVRGAAIGGGLGLAMMADFRHAEVGATFQANFTRLGYHPGMGLTATLPRAIGQRAAIDLLLTGRRIDAAEAVRIGLCDTVSADRLGLSNAVAQANLLAEAAPMATQSVKATLRADLLLELDKVISHELEEQERLKATDDFREGVAAARDRRKAHFTGT